MKINTNNEKGFAALFVTVLILAAVFAIIMSIGVLTFSEQKILKNHTKSAQAYYLAEAGVEDAILRVKKGLELSSPYTLQSIAGNATVTISDVVGGSRTIVSIGNLDNRQRKISVAYSIDSNGNEFFYGAQVGDGGLVMENLSKVEGNVFSNGSIDATSDSAVITGTAKVANPGAEIEEVTVLGDAYADLCDDASITGSLYYNTNEECVAGSLVTPMPALSPQSLPVSQMEIDDWKIKAALGGTFNGNYTLSDGTTFLGPQKINGNLTIQNDAILYVTGTIWVTGTINVKNSGLVKLASSSYGSLSGVTIADGLITLENNSTTTGSGQQGSYHMYVSTSAANPAIDIKNNAVADILFTSQGWINVQNNTVLREVSGYGIKLQNNAKIKYEVGLADTSFTSGPSGGWKVTSWKEVE